MWYVYEIIMNVNNITFQVLAAEANRNLKNKQETDLTKKQKV